MTCLFQIFIFLIKKKYRFFAKPYPKYKGTFVEIGAYDGLTYSNTKLFEDTFHWNGVLIEANPVNYNKLIKNRQKTKNFHLGVCKEEMGTISFGGSNAIGGDVTQ